MPMAGFEPGSSGDGSNMSAITTNQVTLIFN